MKITKADLKKLVKEAVQKALNEREFPGEEEKGPMSPEEIKAQLEKEKELSKKRRAQKTRAAIKSTTRGMNVEAYDRPKMGDWIADLDDEEEDYLWSDEETEDEEERLADLLRKHKEKKTKFDY